MAEQPVAAAVVIESGRVLLVRRRVAEGALSWQFPAGKIEPGESPATAAVRETLEETGLRVLYLSLLGERVHPVTGRHVHYVECSVIGGTAVVASPRELDAVAWCVRSEVVGRIPEGIYGPVQNRLDEVLRG
ncbi:ADP-ribose pyrophosphatase YjhB (NUDIX family) [Kribbella sp. VKM Ac-2571]|uniref:NUDIX hydrolase n=1 Tax=Kribbella sp. VKM Ac-2571 TaxID=2512222 RepID=UPI00106010FB|nr:NUDIX hydrolase [Kribbella sp. VKM Ac-2571]TDO69141.1 ADP-ribose pyrophosphatase YjhB (NUDIX family) [Kribbella sp. VKM Ac-2571]